MAVFEGFQLTLNCDFVAVADRKYCQVFYGRERLLGEEVAAYSFFDDSAFDQALATATALSGKPYFEKLWSAKRFDDRPGGYVCLKRQQGASLVTQLRKVKRKQQFLLCMKLIKAVQAIHAQGRAHGALDEDNVLFDERLNTPNILEVLSGFHVDQLEPHLCAPEQIQKQQVGFATDVYWLGNLFLREIRRPSFGLRQLIKRCTATDPGQRPKLEDLAKNLSNLLANDWEEAAKNWLRPQWSLKLAGGAILLAAGAILAFDQGIFTSSPPPVNFETQLGHRFDELSNKPSKEKGLSEIMASASTEHQWRSVIHQVVQKAMSDKTLVQPAKQILRTEYTKTADIQNRERLIAGISDINFSQLDRGLREEGYVNDLDEQIVGVMLFDWPLLLVKDEVWELGDWVTANGFQGYLSSISLTHIDIKDGRENHTIDISTPPQMTNLDWADKNIYIRGKQANMRTVIHAFKYLGFDILEEGQGGSPGVISGYFSFPTPKAFLDEIKSHLRLTVSGATVWIEDSQDLRTYIPLFHYYINEDSCDGVISNLMQYTGFNYSLASNCDGPSTVYFVNTELKAVLEMLGYKWRPQYKDSGMPEILFFRKE